MSSLTSNGSFSSLSISGSGTKSGNITWTPPTLPDGATIQSITLTANLSISMSRGSTTVTINGKTYKSSTSLSIDLGTSLTSSLSVSAKGSSFLAKGTVSISNIVYTVNYVIKHVITSSFNDGGTISESGNIEVVDGGSKTFTFTPNTGYKIADVVVDGVSVGSVTSYTFNNVTSNHTISVSFSPITANLTVVNNTNNSNIVSYPSEKQLVSGSVDVIVTTPHNEKFRTIKNGNSVEFNKLSNQVFTFEDQVITDGCGKGTMYCSGSPIIDTDGYGYSSVYLDSNSSLKTDISSYYDDKITISFNFYITNLQDGSKRNILKIDDIFYIDFVGYKLRYSIYNKEGKKFSYTSSEDNAYNDNGYTLTYCRNGDNHYIFLDGVLIASKVYTNVDSYDFLKILGEGVGYVSLIMICDNCLYTTDFDVYDMPYEEKDFTGKYAMYYCDDESIFNVPYINSDLLTFKIIDDIKNVNNVFYQGNNAITFSNRGIRLGVKRTISTFSLSFWYKISEVDSSNVAPCLFRVWYNSGINISLFIKHDNYSSTNLVLLIYDGEFSARILDFVMDDNQNYFITFENTGTQMNLYINGTYVDGIVFDETSGLIYIDIGCDGSSSPAYPGYFGNINFVEGLVSNGNSETIYPTNYPIEDIYKYTTTITSDNDINIEILKKLPILSFNQITRNKISSILGFDSSVAEFTSDTDLTEWEARATVEGQPYGHGIGTLVDGGTTLLANETATVTIDDEELTNGDVEYRISVYGKDGNGAWSDE